MNTTSALLLTLTLACSNYALASSTAHSHIAHVGESWGDTPNNKGFLETAVSEAKIVQAHAALAIAKRDDLSWIKSHTAHVQHALDAQGKGPGLGYGVLRASQGAAKHIMLAASAADASKNIKIHSVHIAASVKNTLLVAQQMLALCTSISQATDVAQAVPLLVQLQRLAKILSQGVDANGDGKITWVKGEGGLVHASKHLALLRSAEKL